MDQPAEPVVFDHPLIRHKLTALRDERTDHPRFRELMSQIASLMVYEMTRGFATSPCAVRTPTGDMADGARIRETITVVPVLRAGLGMTDGILRVMPEARIGHLGMSRDEESMRPTVYLRRLPQDLDSGPTMLVDPMRATGGAGVAAAGGVGAGGGGQALAGGEAPVLAEDVLQLAHHRPLDPELEVARALGVVPQNVAAADVHAAGEGGLSVHHQQLAVVAQVQVGRRRQQARGQETGHRHPGAAQQARGPGEVVALAHRVDEDAHRHPAPVGRHEGVDEPAPGGVRLEQIGGQEDPLARLFDGGQHGRVGAVAVLQHRQLVARQQRAAGHLLGDAHERELVLGQGRDEAVAQGRFRRRAPFVGDVEEQAQRRDALGARLDAVDSK